MAIQENQTEALPTVEELVRLARENHERLRSEGRIPKLPRDLTAEKARVRLREEYGDEVAALIEAAARQLVSEGGF